MKSPREFQLIPGAQKSALKFETLELELGAWNLELSSHPPRAFAWPKIRHFPTPRREYFTLSYRLDK
jgi:hypothetical protein